MADYPLPQWISELTTTFVPGEDHLGVEGAAQGYQQWLIPGIITTTDRARYYSIYAWILHRFINHPGSSLLLKDFRGQFFKRHEIALILGAYSHHKDHEIITGLVGSGINNSKVHKWWDASDPVSLDLNYFQNTLGGLGQYYLTAMQTMGIVGTSEHPSWVYRLTTRGEELAKAYQRSIEVSRYAHNLTENKPLTLLSHEDAGEYGIVGCICPEALAMGHDLSLLRDAFFRFDQQGLQNPHVRRRTALAVMLDIVRGSAVKFKREFLRPALYLGELLPGQDFQPTQELKDWYFRWKLVEVRHIYTFGLQSLWGGFLLYLRQLKNGVSIGEYEEWLRSTLGDAFFTQSLKDYLDTLCLEVGLEDGWGTDHGRFDQVCKQATEIDEYSLFIKAFNAQTNPEVLLKNGIRILAQLFIRFQHWYLQQDEIWQEMAKRERLPLNIIFQFTNDCLSQEGFTLGSWIMRLYREYIWGQHEFMALEKLRYQGYDTFKFNYRDGRFYWPFSSPDAYREPVRLAANRLNNAMTILIDLGLVVKGEEERLSLSVAGEYHLKKSIEAIRYDH